MTGLRTRRPTGLPSWPIVLIAGAEKAGKSWACAEASASHLIGRTLWLGMGEDDPDEYANVPGANFEIVEHNGTYRGLLDSLMAAVAEPDVDGKPTLIVIDSMTRLWNVLCDMAQDTANERAKKKGRATDEADISMDLWNIAKSRWANVMDTLREHDGPVLLTARLDEVTVMSGGKPTTDKVLKVQAEKSLPYDVGAVVEMTERGKTFLKGVRSSRLQLAERTQIPGFTVDALWRNLGLHELQTAPRSHPKPAERVEVDESASADWMALIESATTLDEVRAIWRQINDARAMTSALEAALNGRARSIKAATETSDGADVTQGGSGTSAPVATDAAPSEPEPATRGDLQTLGIRLGKLGINDPQDRLDWTGGVVGRVITSSKELTHDEALNAIAIADQQLAEPSPAQMGA